MPVEQVNMRSEPVVTKGRLVCRQAALNREAGIHEQTQTGTGCT